MYVEWQMLKQVVFGIMEGHREEEEEDREEGGQMV